MRRGETGFTLLETLLASFFVLVILLGALGLAVAGVNWWKDGWNRMDAQQNARVALMHMTREIRMAVKVMDGSNKRVLIVSDPSGRQLKYDLEGDCIRRSVKNNGSKIFSGYNILAYGVKELEFSFDKQEMAAESSIVKIKLVTTDPQGREFKVYTDVAIRLKVFN